MPSTPITEFEGMPLGDEPELPQAESLAADDVAKARAEREAQAALSRPAPADAPVQTHKKADEAGPASVPKPAPEPVKHAQAAQGPGPAPAPGPGVATPLQRGGGDKRKHKREQVIVSRPEQNGELISSDAEAVHNKPTAAEEQQGKLTGKLIMPTSEKPKVVAAEPKLEKPKKLAPGEVFVDENGNVMSGD